MVVNTDNIILLSFYDNQINISAKYFFVVFWYAQSYIDIFSWFVEHDNLHLQFWINFICHVCVLKYGFLYDLSAILAAILKIQYC